LQNAEIARTLETIAMLMELKDEAYYRVLGYRRAAESVAALGRPTDEVADLTELPHVGGTLAGVIRDLSEDRTPEILANLLEEIPAGLVEVTRLPGVGPRTAGRLWRELGITNVEALGELEEGRLAALKGFGKKSEERILRAARTYNS
jgi:DNA polymerase (family X)